MKNNAFIAKRKSDRLHVIIRAYRKEAVQDADYRCSLDTFNRFILSRNAEEFMNSLDWMHALSLHPVCKHEREAASRVMTCGRFRSMLSHYETCDAVSLAEELTVLKFRSGNAGKTAQRRMQQERDAIAGNAFEEHIASLGFDDADIVSVEPLQDWITVHNLLVLGLFFIHKQSSGRSLERRRGAQSADHLIAVDDSSSVFDLPFKFNTFFSQETVRRQVIGGVVNLSKGYDYVDPVFYRFFQRDGDGEKRLRLSNSGHVFSCTTPVAKQHWPSLSNEATFGDREMIIGFTERRMGLIAEDYLKGVSRTAMTLKGSDGCPIGWEADFSAIPEDSGFIKPKFHSQLASLFYYMAYHPGAFVACCKTCENRFLASNSGKRREFCSPTCKTKNYTEGQGGRYD